MTTFLITGSNRGIGLELCKQIHLRGDNVIATCRDSSYELDNLGVRVERNVDITSSSSIKELIDNLKGIKLDCLIHNAGIYEFNSLENLNKDSVKKQFEINALAPIYMTKLMLNLMKANSKIGFITSRMGSIGDNSSGSSYGYRMSKAALCMGAKSISLDLLKKQVYVAIIHPGLVSTRMTGYTKNGISTKESAIGIINRLKELNITNTGTFWHSNGEILPW